MPKIQKPICLCLIASLLLMSCPRARGESVEDKFTQISPQSHTDGEIHGAGYGKLLMRVLMFGAVPKQGVHYMPEGTDLLFALLYAGGRQTDTKLNGITIRRRGLQNLIEVDLDDLMEDGGQIPRLQDGDVVNIPFNWRKNYADIIFYTSILTTFSTLILTVTLIAHP